LRAAESGALYVPVNVPGIIEGLVAGSSLKVIRTKADPRSMMAGCQKDGFHPSFDGLYQIVHLMELMAGDGLRLSALIRTIPSYGMRKERVDCPWQAKGKVMRFLMEETQGKPVELIDGIKVFHD